MLLKIINKIFKPFKVPSQTQRKSTLLAHHMGQIGIPAVIRGIHVKIPNKLSTKAFATKYHGN